MGAYNTSSEGRGPVGGGEPGCSGNTRVVPVPVKQTSLTTPVHAAGMDHQMMSVLTGCLERTITYPE
jgi:hypothetical protein